MPAADEVSRDNPGALPYQRSAAQSERTWIGLGLAAWNGGTGVEWWEAVARPAGWDRRPGHARPL